MTRGNLEYRLKVEGKDELSQVGKQFNAMADRIEDQVTSLQALVNENHVLVQQAEYAASLEERRKLARDLHDAVSQQLFAVSMTMAALPRLIDQQPDRAKQHLQQVEEMIIQAQQELRGLIMHLRPVTLEGHSLAVGLEQLLEELRVKNPDLQIQWEIDPIDTLEDGIEDQLFRVAQEAISNVLRHSKALEFKLILRAKPERVYFKLEDNGIGFSLQESRKASYGLQTMRERIEKIGGSLDILTYPGKGTKIDIRVPIQLGKGANHE
ncbi:HAMP domain-containing sensor histidine kinase [Caldalkalibacillus mannanilyticus]|uniref:HAMP domain-containing sensor histidine kinase n=1 Tax=Caldalkalibacillus mannanilyticus TaxID=1418 RepID=UPI001F1CA68D|nr:histidine kinase [Caldalkalibacillus mannanilyticus]